MESHQVENKVSRPKLIVIQKAFTVYRKGIFDRLSKDYDLTLLHSKSSDGIKQTQQHYSRIVKSFKYGRKTTSVFLNVFPAILKLHPDVVVHEFSPSLISIFPLLALKKLFKYKVILWGHGFNRKQGLKGNKISYLLRKFLIKRSDAVLFYGSTNKEIVERMIPGNKYFIANNSLDTTELGSIKHKLEKTGKENVKNELKVGFKHNIIFIGRLLKEKLLSDLFAEVIKSVQGKVQDLGLIIIGDGPEKNNLMQEFKRKGLENYNFLGGMHDELLVGKYLYISDILLMPGYVGLGLNHALSYGTPVATFRQGPKGPYHSPEIEYLEHGKTGFIADPFNVDEMSDYIIDYLSNKEMQLKMRNSIKKCIETKCNIITMKRGFDEAIKFCLNERM